MVQVSTSDLEYLQVRSYKCAKNLVSKRLTIVHVYIFQPKTEFNDFSKQHYIPSERASQEEQNGPSFSIVAPSSEE